MRLAVVLVAVYQRSSFEASPVDCEWLLELAARHELEVFVDQATEGSERLRRAEVPVTVSIKRSVEGCDGRRISADALQARAISQSHDQAPFVAILYGSDVAADFAWFEPSLCVIPRGVALGSGLAHDLQAVWEDRRLFARMARRMWSLTGLAASADFLVSDAAPEAFGLRDDGLLPPRYTTGAEDPVPVESSSPLLWVAVAATSLGARGLEDLVQRVVSRIPAQGTVTYLIAIRPPLPDGVSLEKTLLGNCPQSLRRRIVVAPAGDDGVAADFFAAADVVVAASAAELAVPGIADAARSRGWILLDEPVPSAEPAGVFPGDLLPKAGRRVRSAQVLTWESPPSRFRRTLEDVGRDIGAEDLLVIHAEGRIGPAARLFALADLRGVDLVVWGRPDGVLGSPDPNSLYPYAMAVRGAAVPAVATAAFDCESIWQLVVWAVSQEWIDRLRLLVLPAPAESECWEVGEVDHVGTFWSPSCGVLPAPRWISSIVREPAETASPQPVSLPRRRFFPPQAEAPTISFRSWVRRSRWIERVLVALPWRWGILDRVMRSRRW